MLFNIGDTVLCKTLGSRFDNTQNIIDIKLKLILELKKVYIFYTLFFIYIKIKY
jgi:hypothetical protein